MYGQYIIIIIIVIVIIIYSGTFYKKSVVEHSSKKTRKRKLKAKVPADQTSPSSEDCIPGTPLKSPFPPDC